MYMFSWVDVFFRISTFPLHDLWCPHGVGIRQFGLQDHRGPHAYQASLQSYFVDFLVK